MSTAIGVHCPKDLLVVLTSFQLCHLATARIPNSATSHRNLQLDTFTLLPSPYSPCLSVATTLHASPAHRLHARPRRTTTKSCGTPRRLRIRTLPTLPTTTRSTITTPPPLLNPPTPLAHHHLPASTPHPALRLTSSRALPSLLTHTDHPQTLLDPSVRVVLVLPRCRPRHR